MDKVKYFFILIILSINLVCAVGINNPDIPNVNSITVYHNDLDGLQGGLENEYYHLNKTVYDNIQANFSGSFGNSSFNQSLTDSLYWTVASDQNSLSGNKNGTYNLNTTGNVTAGKIIIPSDDKFNLINIDRTLNNFLPSDSNVIRNNNNLKWTGASSGLPAYYGFYNYILDYRNLTSGSFDSTVGAIYSNSRQTSFSENSQTFMNEWGIINAVGDIGKYKNSNANAVINTYASENIVSFAPTVDKGSYTLTANVFGNDIDFTATKPTITSGNLVRNDYGQRITMPTQKDGTTKAYGLYLDIGEYDNTYAIYLKNLGESYFNNNNLTNVSNICNYTGSCFELEDFLVDTATNSSYAEYQFKDNNFNGSGNITANWFNGKRASFVFTDTALATSNTMVFYHDITPSSDSAFTYRGIQGFTRAYGSNALSGTLMGFQGGVISSATGLVSTAHGANFYVYASGSGNITTAHALNLQVYTDAGKKITNARGIYIDTPSNSGTITNTYGLQIASQRSGTQTNTYGIYQAGTNDINYFAGKVGIGTTTPTEILSVTGNISVSQLIKLDSITLPTCATATDGFIGRNATGLYYCNSTGWKNIA